jgi:hypothetical protein
MLLDIWADNTPRCDDVAVLLLTPRCCGVTAVILVDLMVVDSLVAVMVVVELSE